VIWNKLPADARFMLVLQVVGEGGVQLTLFAFSTTATLFQVQKPQNLSHNKATPYTRYRAKT